MYSRITIETGSGNRIDIVKSEDDAVSAWYILQENLRSLVDRVKDLRVKRIDGQTMRILQSEGLITNTGL